MKYFVLLLVLCLPLHFAQAFDLFDPERGKEKVVQPEPKPEPKPNPFAAKKAPPPPKPKRLKPQKDFTIRGISRIGQKYAVVLQGPDNKQFIEYWQSGNPATPLKNHAQHKLLKVTSRGVTIGYPSDAPCQKSKDDKGLTCSQNGHTGTVSLVHRKAIAVATPTPPVNANPNNNPVNPFEAALKRQREQETAQANNNQNAQNNRPTFQPKRIKPEDVPPGMRVVRTPFGDRLVPQNQGQPQRRSDLVPR